jgi:hypothetical protein
MGFFSELDITISEGYTPTSDEAKHLATDKEATTEWQRNKDWRTIVEPRLEAQFEADVAAEEAAEGSWEADMPSFRSDCDNCPLDPRDGECGGACEELDSRPKQDTPVISQCLACGTDVCDQTFCDGCEDNIDI